MKFFSLFVKTLLDAIKVRFFLLREWSIQVGRYFLFQPRYFFADACLVLSYFFKSPYRIVREWDEKHTKKVGPYGELPISEVERIHSVLLSDVQYETFYDFGSGRGRLALWAAMTKGKKVSAVEYVSPFCQKLKRIKTLFRIPNIDIVENAYEKVALDTCDLLLINPGELEALQEKQLIKTLSRQHEGSYVLSIGFIVPSAQYDVQGIMPLRTPWGEDFAVLQKKIIS